MSPRPNPQEARERAEPAEGAEPVPALVWAFMLGLAVWGAGYLLLYAGDPGEIAGDMRTADPAEAP